MSLEILFNDRHLPTSWIVIQNPRTHLNVVGRGYRISHTGVNLNITMEWCASKKVSGKFAFHPEHNQVFEFDLTNAHIVEHEDGVYCLSCSNGEHVEFHTKRSPINVDKIIDFPIWLRKSSS